VLIPAACHARPVKTPVVPWPGGLAQRGKTACAARGNTRAGRRGGALADGSAAASRRQGVVGDLEGATGEVPGKEEGAGAHQNCGPMVRRRKQRRVAVFNGSGVAPVVVDECAEILQLKGDQRG
jgi:hypothetical protein